MSDHREVEQLFNMMEAARATGNVDEQRYVSEHVVEDLSVHAVIEEEILYPAMREALQDGDVLVDEALREHQDAKEFLTRIDGEDPQSEDTRETFDHLVPAVRHHVEEEEGQLSPRLREALSEERLQKMGEQLDKARQAAPTHPHPHAPNTLPGNVAAGGFAAVVEDPRRHQEVSSRPLGELRTANGVSVSNVGRLLRRKYFHIGGIAVFVPCPAPHGCARVTCTPSRLGGAMPSSGNDVWVYARAAPTHLHPNADAASRW